MSPRTASLRRRAAAFGAIALTTFVVGAAQAGADPLYGVVPQDGAVPAADDLELMPSGGITGIRLMAHWGSAEPSPGEYQWGTLDAMVRETTNRGITPMLFFYGTPVWATQRDGRDCLELTCTVYPPRSDSTRAAFADFARAAVKRYGPGGDFWKKPSLLPLPDPYTEGSGLVDCDLLPILCPPDPNEPPPLTPPPPAPPSPVPPPGEPPCGCTEPSPLRVWQVWNEQNSPKYFAPKVSVKLYAKMLKSAGDAIHSVDPGADVMLGGMWGPSNAKNVVMPVKPYLKKLYKIKGVKKTFDSIALHPYSSGPKGSLAALELGRKLVKRAGDRKVGMWVSELGWASGGPKSNPYVKGKKGQARLLKRALGSFEKRSRALKLRGVYWYSWRDMDGGDAICDWCGYAGLRARDGSAKPAWKAFSRVARR
jgi:hypothetical protein